MINKLKFAIFSLFLLAGIARAQLSATSAYVTPAGAATGNCPTGTGSAPNFTPAQFNTSTNWGTGTGKIGAGTIVLVCGTFTGAVNTTLLSFQGSGSSGNVITLKFDTGALLQSNAWSYNGAVTTNGKSYILIDGGTTCGHTTTLASISCNGTIQNLLNGVSGQTCLGGTCSIQQASSGIVVSGSSTNVEIRNLQIQGIYYEQNSTGGTPALQTADILISTPTSAIHAHNNYLTEADQSIDVDFDYGNQGGAELDHNFLGHHAWGAGVGNGTSASYSATVWFHDNEVTNWNDWNQNYNTYHTDGIHIFTIGGGSGIVTAYVYKNYFHGALAGNTTFAGTGYIYADLVSGSANASNQILWAFGNIGDASSTNISAWTTASSWNGTHWINNTLLGQDVYLSGQGTNGFLPTGGTGAVVENSIFDHFYSEYQAPYSALTGGVFATTDYNLFYDCTSCFIAADPAYTSYTFAQWQAIPLDVHSQYANPNLNASTYAPLTGSPAITGGTNLYSLFGCSSPVIPGLGAGCSDINGVAWPSSGAWGQGAVAFAAVPSVNRYVGGGHKIGGGHSLGPAPVVVAGGSCAAPTYCAYDGPDLVASSGPYALGGLVNNYATVYDTSYLGHTNADGTTFSNSSYLSGITRVTDTLSSKTTTDNFTAGMGGAGNFRLTNLSTTLTAFTDGGQELVCRFNPSGSNKGFCTSGGWYNNGTYSNPTLFITEGQNSTTVCNTNCALVDFGSVEFSPINDTLAYTYGTSSDHTNPTAVFATTVNSSTGQYTPSTTPLVDFGLGFPAAYAQNWAASTSYSYGTYIIHPLSTAEMATGGVWQQSHAYALGDILVAQSGSACMYKAVTAGTSASTGTGPAFITSGACKTEALTDGTVKWNGTNSTAQFLYQDTTTGTHTSGSSFVISGHPDTLSTFTDGSITWTNVGTAYVPINGNQVWHAVGGESMDSNYQSSYAQFYGAGFSTNTYGALSNNYKFQGTQDTGFWLMRADAVNRTYDLLNTGTGIWTETTCTGGGTGYNCSGGTWTQTLIGTLQAITNPFANGSQACPWYIHDDKMAVDGLHSEAVTGDSPPYSACDPIENFQVWRHNPALFDQYASLQITGFGMAHWAIDKNTTVAESSSGWGYTAGVYIGVYNVDNVSGTNGNPPLGEYPTNTLGYPPAFSYYLPAIASQATAQSFPWPGCYVTSGTTQKNPDCNLSEVFGSHVSRAAGPGTDTWPACGTTYNLNPENGLVVNAMQNEITCFSTSPLYPTGYTPGSSWSTIAPGNGSPICVPGTCSQRYGWAKRYGHTNGTQTSRTFSTQFSVTHYSQDGNWMFASTDNGCSFGSQLTGNAAPAVWASGTYYQQLMLTAVGTSPSTPNSLCGFPWQALHTYVSGNLIGPMEGTNGSSQIDDVFQLLYVATGAQSGPQSSLTSNNPKCGTTSCFANTNPPTVTPIAGTAATESGTTATVTVATAMPLTLNVYVTLAGWTPSGYNGTWLAAASSGTTVTLSGLPSGLGAATVMGTVAAQGDRVCDLASGTDTYNPVPPYSSSCVGLVWQDLGPNTQRGDVVAFNLGH
jgi:hypothetical protein